MEFKEFLNRLRPENQFKGRILSLDPGFTTGECIFEDAKLIQWDQIKTYDGKIFAWQPLEDLITKNKIDYIVCEDYRMYQSKLQAQSFSKVETIRIIGVIDYLAWKNNIPITYQMASMAKGFVSDDKLKMWDLYKDGMKHSRDAIRHNIYFQLFKKNN